MFHHFFKRYKYENTRQYLRLPAIWLVKCTVLSASNGQSLDSTRNVSAGGVSLVSQERVPVGSHLKIDLHVPPLNRSLSTNTVVVRCLPRKDGRFDLGLRFLDLSEKDRADLDQAISHSVPSRHKALQQKSWWRKIP